MACMRVSANWPIRSMSTATNTLSTESRLTAERQGTGSSPGSRTTSLARPRTVVVQGQPRRGPAEVSRRRGTARRRGAARSRRTRTTTLLLALAASSCRSRGSSKRRQITPFVCFVKRVLVIGGIGGVDLGRAVAIEQRFEGLIDERGVSDSGAESPRAVK